MVSGVLARTKTSETKQTVVHFDILKHCVAADKPTKRKGSSHTDDTSQDSPAALEQQSAVFDTDEDDDVDWCVETHVELVVHSPVVECV